MPEQPSKDEWRVAIQFGSCLILKVRIMTWGSSVPLDSVYRIVYRFELVFRLKVMYRVVTKLSLHDHMITLVAALLLLTDLA
jgi:hypothetical protein